MIKLLIITPYIMELSVEVYDYNKCTILNEECLDLIDPFSYANYTLILKENNTVVSCLGYSIDRDRINIDGTCTSKSSRNKKYNSILRIILFIIAKLNKIKYITSSTNSKSMAIMRKTLNASCDEELYLEECDYECNCLVDVENINTNLHIDNKIKEYLKIPHFEKLSIKFFTPKAYGSSQKTKRKKSRPKKSAQKQKKTKSKGSATKKKTIH